MVAEMDVCRALLEPMAAASEVLNRLEARLLGLPVVTKTHRGLDIRTYHSGLVVERYVEADLIDTRNICWWLEFSPTNNDHWRIEASIYVSHGEVLHRFPDAIAGNLAELASILKGVSRNLETSIEVISNVRRVVHRDFDASAATERSV